MDKESTLLSLFTSELSNQRSHLGLNPSTIHGRQAAEYQVKTHNPPLILKALALCLDAWHSSRSFQRDLVLNRRAGAMTIGQTFLHPKFAVFDVVSIFPFEWHLN